MIFIFMFNVLILPSMIALDYLSLMLIFYELDLRDDKQFFIDHPGAVPISTAQVNDYLNWFSIFKLFFLCDYKLALMSMSRERSLES